jgi:hypothetical protein
MEWRMVDGCAPRGKWAGERRRSVGEPQAQAAAADNPGTMRLSPLLRLAAATLALACLPGHAAEWTQLPGAASSGATVYTDVASERSRHGKLVGYLLPNPRQAWFLTDYATPHRWKLFEIRSSKQLIEFDCKRSSMRLLARLYYEGTMAQGRLLASETPAADFTLVVPGDVEEAMQQSACRPPARSENQAATVVPTMAGDAPSALREAAGNAHDPAAAAVTAGALPGAAVAGAAPDAAQDAGASARPHRPAPAPAPGAAAAAP